MFPQQFPDCRNLESSADDVHPPDREKACSTGLSYCLKYADDSTDENPVVLAKGVDENGKEFEQRIYINDVDPSNATVVEMRALEAHYKVEKQGGFTSLPSQ